MIKILKRQIAEDDKIIITEEGYLHALPVFDKEINEEDLQIPLEKWKIKQDELDILNLKMHDKIIKN